MSALVTQLLALARAGKCQGKAEAAGSEQLVYGEALPFESVAYEAGKDLRYAISDSIWIDGDESQLKQLVSILIDNALHHGIGKHVQLQLSREKHLAVLRVTNEGEPISPEDDTCCLSGFTVRMMHVHRQAVIMVWACRSPKPLRMNIKARSA